jgi:hypothetical protein
MNNWIKSMIVGVLAWSMAGCSTLTGGPLVEPGTPTGVIEVVNQSNLTMTQVLISRCSAMSYGLNRLPSGVVVRPGRAYRFTVSAGCWDVGAGGPNGQMYGTGEAYRRFNVPAGRAVRWTVTGG